MIEKLPRIRAGVLPTELGDELLIYSPETETAHCLGVVGKVVFHGCQSGMEPGDLVARVTQMGIEDGEAAMLGMLEQLAEKGITEPAPIASEFDRRRFLALTGRWASAMVVASAIAPRPAEAGTCYECLTVGAPTFAPVNCNTCSQICKFTAAGACQATAVCCFEYRLSNTTIDPTGACNLAEALGLYGCRSIPAAPSVFHSHCGTARTNCISAGGTPGTLYYCCACAGNAPTFSCT